MNSDLKYWIAFNQIREIGAVKFQKLLKYFGQMETAWQANLPDFINAGINEKLAHQIITQKNQLNPDQELEKILKENISAVTLNDKNYPSLLKEIYDPPSIIYFQGLLNGLKQSTIAVIGARKYTAYGQQAVREITAELAKQNITIISGLALGIDAMAHQACLEAGGQTIAVLGSSVEDKNILPATNKNLAYQIIKSGGAIISEYPIPTSPSKLTFPMRNRIISGLSLGTLVIEAKESSGTMITAKSALDQNRDVFAVPGSIFNFNSIGTNNLIKQGARLTSNADDILEELNLKKITENLGEETTPDLNEDEKLIYKLLSKEPIHIDKIAQRCKLNINVLSGLLTMMEIKKIIRDVGGKNYIKN